MKWLVAATALLAQSCLAKSQWTVENGKLSIIHQGHSLSSNEFKELGNDIHLPSQSTIELLFETNDGTKSKRAHQTLAMLRDEKTGLQFSYPPSNVKPNGKAKISIQHRSIPAALQNADKLTLSLIIGSFNDEVEPVKYDVTKELLIDDADSIPEVQRMEHKPDIIHQYKPDPKQVATPIALLFACGALGLLVCILGWFGMIGSFGGLGNALQTNPVGHVGLICSLFAFEITFFLYYRGQSIFDTLTVVAVLSPFAVFTGSRALREVRQKRQTEKKTAKKQ